MGAAEVDREVGDAGGPLLVGAIATVSTRTLGMTRLAILPALTAVVVAGRRGTLFRTC
jgi:hypothetical protein